MILHLLPFVVGLTVTGQNHIPTTAITTDFPTASGNATTSPPNLIPPPPSLPKIPNNRSITIINSCSTDIWPALLTTNNTGPYMNGFYLPSQKSVQLWVSFDWTGRIWARTNCSFNESTNTGPCFTGSCANVLNCSVSGSPPTTYWPSSPAACPTWKSPPTWSSRSRRIRARQPRLHEARATRPRSGRRLRLRERPGPRR